MTWIKVSELKPPVHEVILFRDIAHNEHYGVLCGDLSEPEIRNKFWCHIFQKSYPLEDVIYWCEIPINAYLIRDKMNVCFDVNKFLWNKCNGIEEKILKEFEEHLKENPQWDARAFVTIAVRNSICRIIKLLRVID